ncbi:histidine phosphatase family protein [Subtercola boreus]|uniref:Histidine phosphatase family protein n=1 Tax=Subtercola boreus TaxID=120213 RepID=A0A3E0W696_9MICO|nr:histidine phosphatase family protein [Subtercola boreus]RFA17590.1 hypothetical protein B7R24_16960 [Subtercola boreus]RFA17673.1 hypothetical protein B7R23_16905 [Subtercola boreus]RFA24263.1 hypothetical protein B7R25_17060 [Subtercola boreus]
MRLLLIRHAETKANVAGTISSWSPGENLTTTGRVQAKDLATRLTRTPLDGIYTSHLIRTQQTGAPLALDQGLPLTVLDGTHEIEGGDLEGASGALAMRAYVAPLLMWGEGDFSASIPGGHDGTHFFTRFDAAIATIVDRHTDSDTVALISHDGCMRVWVAGRANNVGPDYTSTHALKNTDIVTMSGDFDHGWHVESWGSETLP